MGNSMQQSYPIISVQCKHKNSICSVRYNVVILPVMFFCLFFLQINTLYAHSPHDVISSLEISPKYHEDQTLFLVEHKGFMVRSSDGGFTWKKVVKGIDANHLLTSLEVSPTFHLDKTLFLSTQGDGVFKSIDGANSWFKVNNGLCKRVDLLSISKNYLQDNVVLAAGSDGGLYKTKDGGREWSLVIDEKVRIRSIAFYPDTDDRRILVGDDDGNLYFSTNGGEEWKSGFQFQNCGAITAIAISPDVSVTAVIFIGTEKGGVWKSMDSGISFIKMNKGVSGDYITSLAISPNYEKDSTVFASTWYEAVFESVDGGNSWKKYNNGLTTHRQADSGSHRSPHFMDLRISKTFSDDKTIFLGGFDGLFKSIDGGHNWMQMETRPLRLIMGFDLSPGQDTNYTIALTTYGGGAYTSIDQGKTWSIKNIGLITTRLFDITFSPDYHLDKQIFTGSMLYLLRTKYGSNSWEPIKTYKTNWVFRFCSWLESINLPYHQFIRRIAANKMIKIGINPNFVALSPDFAKDKTLFIGTRSKGVFKSSDGGLSFQQILDGKGNKTTSLVLSSNFSSDKTVFACLRSEGVYKSIDCGKTWQQQNSGLQFQKYSKTLLKSDYLLVVSPDYKRDNTVFAGTDVGLFKTTNGGDNWKRLELSIYGGSMQNIKSLAISPNYRNDQTVMVSVNGKGLLKTEDAGITWNEIGTELMNDNYLFHFLQFSPLYPADNTIYGASHEELFRSTDSGNSWEIVKRPVRYEDMRDVIKYEGKWELLEDEGYSARSVNYSEVANNRAALTFVGTGVSWIGTKSHKQGIANVYIDGDFKGTVDQFSSEREKLVQQFSIKELPNGVHTIIVEVTKNKNTQSVGNATVIDAFDVLP